MKKIFFIFLSSVLLFSGLFTFIGENDAHASKNYPKYYPEGYPALPESGAGHPGQIILMPVECGSHSSKGCAAGQSILLIRSFIFLWSLIMIGNCTRPIARRNTIGRPVQISVKVFVNPHSGSRLSTGCSRRPRIPV